MLDPELLIFHWERKEHAKVTVHSDYTDYPVGRAYQF